MPDPMTRTNRRQAAGAYGFPAFGSPGAAPTSPPPQQLGGAPGAQAAMQQDMLRRKLMMRQASAPPAPGPQTGMQGALSAMQPQPASAADQYRGHIDQRRQGLMQAAQQQQMMQRQKMMKMQQAQNTPRTARDASALAAAGDLKRQLSTAMEGRL